MRTPNLLILLSLISCSAVKEGDPKLLPATLAETNACMLLYDMKAEKVVEVINEERCRRPMPPCSTFKVPLAVMGFDTGKFKSAEDRPYKWDGKKRKIEAWNQEQNVRSWMQNSVVWFSQELTKELGRKKVQSYLDQFDYGNQDFSGGLTDAWLTNVPSERPDTQTSVKISAYEQLNFLKALYGFKLPVSLNAMTSTISLLSSETSKSGAVLEGKTGSGFLGPKAELRLGWYVGHLRSGNDEYLAVMTFDDRMQEAQGQYGGMVAREALKEVLAAKGLW